jgi:hypothetical protein
MAEVKVKRKLSNFIHQVVLGSSVTSFTQVLLGSIAANPLSQLMGSLVSTSPILSPNPA